MVLLGVVTQLPFDFADVRRALRGVKPAEDPSDVKFIGVPGQSDLPALGGRTVGEVFAHPDPKPEPAAFAVDAGCGSAQRAGDRTHRNVVEPERNQTPDFLDRPRIQIFGAPPPEWLFGGAGRSSAATRSRTSDSSRPR